MTQRGYQLGFYEAYEGVRDQLARSRKAEKIEFALRRCGHVPLETAKVLDIGCSSGLITAALAPLFAQTIGIEYDPGALAYAPRAAPTALQFVRGDAMCLPVADNSVDILICAQVYEHVPSDTQLAREIYRVLRPGGMAFFSGPNKTFPIEPHYFLPALHWLPPAWADAYLRLTRRGTHYYERSRTFGGLRRLFAQFDLVDVTVPILQHKPELVLPKRAALLMARLPIVIWKLLLPLFPNVNWILYKPWAVIKS